MCKIANPDGKTSWPNCLNRFDTITLTLALRGGAMDVLQTLSEKEMERNKLRTGWRCTMHCSALLNAKIRE